MPAQFDPHDPRGGTGPPTGGPLSGVDTSRYSIARVYDVFLDGKAHYPVDVDKAAEIEAWMPGVRELVRANREFVGYAVQSLAEQGHRQFLDVGSGLPTADNTHELARQVAPDAVAVYVDNDPEVVAHGCDLLSCEEGAAVITGDAGHPGDVLCRVLALGLFDPSAPVVLLMTCVLHFLPGDLGPLLDEWYELLPAGSALVVTHGVGSDETRKRACDLHAQPGRRYAVRSPEDLAALFDRGTWHLCSMARVENFTLTADGQIRVEGEGEGHAPRTGVGPDGYLAAMIAVKV